MKKQNKQNKLNGANQNGAIPFPRTSRRIHKCVHKYITRVVNAKQWLEQIHANRTINAYYVV